MSFPKVRVPYLLLLPGFAFLFTFFILPIINLAQTSTQTPVVGGDTGEYEQTLAFGNYIQAFVRIRNSLVDHLCTRAWPRFLL